MHALPPIPEIDSKLSSFHFLYLFDIHIYICMYIWIYICLYRMFVYSTYMYTCNGVSKNEEFGMYVGD